MLPQPPPRSITRRQRLSAATPTPPTIPPPLTPSSSRSSAPARAAMALVEHLRALSTLTTRLPHKALLPPVPHPSPWVPPPVLPPRKPQFPLVICCSSFKCRTRTSTPQIPVPMATECPETPAQVQSPSATRACLSSLRPRAQLRSPSPVAL